MKGISPFRHGIAALLFSIVLAGSMGATWPPEKFNNLKVLPPDTPRRQLLDTMAGFTRALGVRCTYCHVGEEGRPLATYDFESDDRTPKRKAREMMRMVNDLNGKYLPALDDRADPPQHVECVTCHRGTTTPRMLEDVLRLRYAAAGIDSALATYHALRDEYYGRFAYDFGSVPLTDVAAKLEAEGHEADALRLLELNVEVNPQSLFARRQHAVSAVTLAFRTQGVDAGTQTYTRLFDRYGSEAFPENVLNRLGYSLLGEGKAGLAIAVFQLNTRAFPASANAFDSLGEAYLKHGDRALAADCYRKSLALDSTNSHAKKQLESLGAPVKP